MEIVLLGTGAAFPTQHRSTIAIALIRKGEILLFDCGEGTQVQFQKAKLKPGKLKHIFISHFHGDHFYGLIGFLTSLQLNGREKELHIYGPQGLQAYLEFMQELSHFEFVFDVIIHEVNEEENSLVWDFGEYFVKAKLLEHRIFTSGFRIEEKPIPGKFNVKEAVKLGIPDGPLRSQLKEGQSVVLKDGTQIRPEQILGPQQPGKKIAICLDTKPCVNSIELAIKCDLLIHDTTFSQMHQQEAEVAAHSTASQAAEIARQAGAKRLILTHISSRYKADAADMLLEEARSIFPNSELGCDLMRISI